MSTHPQLIGARLGAYDIQALLGSGGMADVYRAFDINLQRAAAMPALFTVMSSLAMRFGMTRAGLCSPTLGSRSNC